ncbi:MAG TPA: hypothetical protein VMN35_07735 [Gaiellaceae bacterium]|nr:hypothetical protein [Gaiellaceae bacterium]
MPRRGRGRVDHPGESGPGDLLRHGMQRVGRHDVTCDFGPDARRCCERALGGRRPVANRPGRTAARPGRPLPAACLGLTPAGIRTGSGTFSNTSKSNLALGSAGADRIWSMAGDDCILGGAGNDSLRGGGGSDICTGSPGTDTFHSSCETQIQ